MNRTVAIESCDRGSGNSVRFEKERQKRAAHGHTSTRAETGRENDDPD